MRRTPSSTYRLQLHPGFNFEDASGVADYLADLGVSHVYSSPYLQSAPGSTHGYDLTDFRQVNRELGGAVAHQRFCQRLGECGLGQILDIVPNHMSLTPTNPYWCDVLENGPVSRYADYFDIDWQYGEERMHNKVLLPILEKQYGLVLASGAIQLARRDSRFEIVLGSIRLPVAPSSISAILAPAAHTLHSDKLAFLADCLKRLASQSRDDRDAVNILRRDRNVLLSLVDNYLAEEGQAFHSIDEVIASINGDMDALDAFLQEQHYRLAYWRAADQDLGYRRFFDVNSLIGVRVEQAHVFLDTHKLIIEWLEGGILDGVRIDHVDGLRDPQQYLERLREHAPEAWIVVEKILARNESLHADWPVQGTSGYDFLNVVNGLLTMPEGLKALEESYEKAIGHPSDYPSLVHEKKVAITVDILGSDVNRLTSIFVQICEADRDHRDFTRAEIRNAIREIASCFSVYRSYVSPERDELTELDAAVIQSAIDVAASYRPDIDRGLFDFISDVLLLRRRGRLESDFLLRFQQFTSPVMAKGLEDTALYCFNRSIGLNDVGSNLADPIVSIEDFHRFNQGAQQLHPLGMVSLTTHDTKRGEDIRARLAVLSEMPQEFSAAVARWSSMNSALRVDDLPDTNTTYLYFQTLIGAWPIDADRAMAYMLKAARESKEQTSWTQNNAKFESALEGFVRRSLADKEFCADVEIFVSKIDRAGRTNSLAQTLLKCTVPGVPDLYQGSELWEFRLVDPDNRTPVDYSKRRQLLAEMKTLSPERIMQRMEEGMPKLWTIYQALAVRRELPECFNSSGDYTPLYASGERSNHVVGFLRGGRIAIVVPRFSTSVAVGWNGTTVLLQKGKWLNCLTGELANGGNIRVEELFSRFPIALLTREEEECTSFRFGPLASTPSGSGSAE